MPSTTNSELLLSVKNLKVHFELEHYQHHGLRDVFVSAVTHPVEFFLKKPELLNVIDDVSFDVTRGMRLGLLGVNGSGKTTLCRCLAGMMVAQSGSITTDAEVRAIFDTGTGILPELTGRENAFLLARLFFPEVKDLRPLVNEAIEFSELGHFLDVPFRQYSKGMQARLMLSLISAKSTDVLILDEVLDGADYFFQQKLSVRMRNFIKSAGATIFVSHSADQVREVCDQVLVMNKGKIGFMGGVEEGLDYYHKNLAPVS
jgi:ABC-type polysaccharide/polyol phosphate transport system ATPase subunit